MTIMLHSGGHKVTLEEVLNVATPPATETWDPMSHGDVIDHIHTMIPSYGLDVVNWDHALRRQGSQYFGLVTVRDNQNRGLTTDDFSLQIGIRNSINKSLAAALVAGSKVFVCDNLAFSGQVAMARKHTPGIRMDLGSKVKNAFEKLLNIFGSQKNSIDQFKSREITNVDQDRLTTLVLRQNILPPSRFNHLEKQFKSEDPSACGGIKEPTLWRFFNGVTQVLKKDHPDVIAERTGKLFRLCENYLPIRSIEVSRDMAEPLPA